MQPGCDPKNKVKRSPKKQHMTCNLCVETSHVIAASYKILHVWRHNYALQALSESIWGFRMTGVKILPFPLFLAISFCSCFISHD